MDIPMDGHSVLWALAGEIQQSMHGFLKRGDGFIMSVLIKPMMRFMLKIQTLRVSDTALSYTGIHRLDNGYGSTQVRALHAFASNNILGPKFCIIAGIFNRRLILDTITLDTDLDRAKMQLIAREIGQMLSA